MSELREGLNVPEEIIQAAGLTGEPVEVEIKDGGIFLRRRNAQSEAASRVAAALERMVELSKIASLEGLSIRELRDEGRR